MSDRSTDVSIIEQYKENIQPLPGGRSASKLASNFITASKSALKLKDQLNEERKHLEEGLLNLEEVDDPLQEFVLYINWIRENYPQGANTDSGLLNLLERCTSHFRDTQHYKNDPRYLKVWLDYTKFSDSPKDIYIYLAKKGIGNQLALYYEEFAKYLELKNKLDDAKQIYNVGIENNARPLVRLKKSYQKFLERCEPLGTNENDGRNTRNVLTLKRGSSVSPSEAENDENERKKSKIEIFQDDDNVNDQQLLNSIFKGPVKELGSIKSRTKENTQEAKPWSGEIIRQKTNQNINPLKIEVFKDSEGNSDNNSYHYPEENQAGNVHTVIKIPGKKLEKVLVNLELLYPSAKEEYSLQEILAFRKNFLKKSELKLKTDNSFKNNSKELHSNDDINSKDVNDLSQDVTTFTIPLRDSSTSNDVVKASQNQPNSPTMTMFSRIAANEVIGIFNDAARNLNSEDEDEKTDYTTNYDGFVTETIPLTNNNDNERLEQNDTPPTDREYGSEQSFHSSPFLETPSINNFSTETKLVTPLDPTVRRNLLLSLSIPLSVYAGYNEFKDRNIGKLQIFDNLVSRSSKSIAVGSPNSIINFCGDKSYCLRAELGRGGFGIVFLIETETGEYEALKIESPSSKWEYYILHQIHRRLVGHRSRSSMFVKPYRLFYFEDESYLFINYCSQGTILDVVNKFRRPGSGADECLCIFLTIELLKVVEILHSIGILHGDLKADNCMLRFEQSDSSKWSEYYNREGLNGWSNKSITLIDFGRAIDLTLFDKDTQFICDWKTNEQDCIQMKRNEPWSFEADYYGLASIIHTMLFGTYMKIKEDNNGNVLLENPFKRYWQRDLWSELFTLLLNPYPRERLNNKRPLVEELKAHRNKFEDWLEKNSGPHNLKSIILGIELDLQESNKKILQK